MTQEKINIAELLKDCPKGMELDCILFNSPVKYESNNDDGSYPISVRTEDGELFYLSKYGCLYDRYDSKCAIFPKGKTTWDGFQRPFKSGDIVAFDNTYSGRLEISIFKNKKENNTLSACYLILRGNELYLEKDMCYVTRFATEEEKKKLFDAIEANGYKWNPKNKTLEKLIKPKFKVGDRIKQIGSPHCYIIKTIEFDRYVLNNNQFIRFVDEHIYELAPNKLVEPKFKVGDNIRIKGMHGIYVVTEIREDCYMLDDKDISLLFKNQDEWDLVPNKFDITTLKPFDKVLWRQGEDSLWLPSFFGFYNEEGIRNTFVCSSGFAYKYCIPYEGNEHLLGKTDDCDEYFKNW